MNTIGTIATIVTIATIALAVLILIGCDKEASFETIESNKSIAKENAMFNAKKWRSTHRPGAIVDTHGDSSIKPTCPQGDGWASVKVLDPETGGVLDDLKCSTYSKADGCILKADFNKRAHLVGQEGGCAKDKPRSVPPFAQ
jgi:hypothetical protein